MPGHHVQVDVKFLQFTGAGRPHVCMRLQFTAIDAATRIRALKYLRAAHAGQAPIDFIDYIVERFPCRIHTIRTDNGHEWQAPVPTGTSQTSGMHHVYIKPGRPNKLNGKVERSHLTDKLEFYQLLDYTGDVDLCEKLAVWEEFSTTYSGRTPPWAAKLPTRCSGRSWYREECQPKS